MPTRIELLGALAVAVDGRRVEGDLPGRQGRLLFACLALNREREVRRDELVDVVWDDRPPGAPDAGLAALLTRLRRALGPEAIEGRGGLRLALPEVSLDVEDARMAANAAEAALGAGDPERAAVHARVALERLERPLLPELTGRWVEERRGELETLHSDALETLARAALRLGAGELPAAERAARTLIAREPYRESAYGVLMEALAARGNLAEALRVYDRLRVLLRDELGATPAPQIIALNERLLSPEAAPAPAAGAAVPLPLVLERLEERPFVGREPELAVLRRRWSAKGGIVVLAGEAGVGKTRLAARFAAAAHAEGATVLHGRIDEETVVPYQPFVEALRHYAAHTDAAAADRDALAPLVPELGGGAEAAEGAAGERENRRYRLFEAVAGLLGQAAAARPLLLVIEDLQWAGRPTLLLLRHVVRRLHGAPLLVLVTVRDAEADPDGAPARLLADLSREEVVQRVPLSGLGEAETAVLVGDAALARTLQDRTAGNPFFIEEMLRSLAEAPEEPPGLPEGVKDLVSRRLSRLAPATVETLTAAAVLGRDFELATLAAMAGRPGEELLDSLEEALRAGVVREDAAQVDHFAFGHALVRETLYDAPAVSRRARLHLRAGEALAAAGAPPGELAHHFFAAREVGGAEAAVAHGAEAARQAVVAHAYEEAAWHLEQALAALGQADALARAELLIALGDVRWQASEPGARAAFDEAAELARLHGAPEALARAVLGAGGRLYMPTARDTAYVGRLEEALAALGDAEGPLRARLLGRLAEHLALADAGDRPARLGAEAVEMARAAGDDGALAAALLGRHAALLDIDHAAERRALIDEALAAAERLAAGELVALSLHWRIYDLVELGDITAAWQSHERLHALAHELHQPLYSHAALAWRGVAAHLNGHLDEAERIARESLRIAEAAGAPEARAFFLTQLFAVRREQGRLAELVDPLERLSHLAGPVGVSWRSTLPFILVEAGEPERARVAYEAVAAGDFAALPTSLFRLTGLICLAEACAALGDATGAASLHARLEPHADRLVQTGFSGCWGSVRRFLGLLAATAGRPDEARAHFEAALQRHIELEAPGLVARTRCDLGELLLGQGEREAGLELLETAGAAAAELGMAGIAARADVSRAGLGAL